jgi:hypothetical protein
VGKLYDDYIANPRPSRKPMTVTEIRAAVSRKVGRPKKPDALTPAQRAKAYRERKASV